MAAMHSRPMIAAAGAVLFLTGLLLWFLHFQAEVPLAGWLHVGTSMRQLAAVIFVTDLGGATVMIPLALAVVAILLLRRRMAMAAWLFGTIASGRLAVELLKHVIGRERPDVSGHLVEVSSASFPSSHSAGTMLTMAALLLVMRPGAAVTGLCLLWPILVGLTRAMLGVHWPSDILAGWGLALLWTAALARWLPRDQHRIARP